MLLSKLFIFFWLKWILDGFRGVAFSSLVFRLKINHRYRPPFSESLWNGSISHVCLFSACFKVLWQRERWALKQQWTNDFLDEFFTQPTFLEHFNILFFDEFVLPSSCLHVLMFLHTRFMYFVIKSNIVQEKFRFNPKLLFLFTFWVVQSCLLDFHRLENFVGFNSQAVLSVVCYLSGRQNMFFSGVDISWCNWKSSSVYDYITYIMYWRLLETF